MTDLRKAAKEVVLAWSWDDSEPRNKAVREAMERLNQALAQPEQEPVAIVNEGMGGIEWLSKPLPDDTPLYTAPPKREWVGLTDKEINKIYDKYGENSGYEYERAIEAKLKEKNT